MDIIKTNLYTDPLARAQPREFSCGPNSKFVAGWGIFLALFFLFSCTHSNPWVFDQIHSEKEEFRSTKLTYHSFDPVRGIDLEFIKTNEHLNIYLNVHSIPVAPYRGDSKKALINLEINQEKIQSFAYRMQGGQRFLLSEEIADLVIQALQEGREVSITLIGYQTRFKPQGFAEQFQKLLHPFLFENPFRLSM